MVECQNCGKKFGMLEKRYKLEDGSLICFECHSTTNNKIQNKNILDDFSIKINEIKSKGAFDTILKFSEKFRDIIKLIAFIYKKSPDCIITYEEDTLLIDEVPLENYIEQVWDPNELYNENISFNDDFFENGIFDNFDKMLDLLNIKYDININLSELIQISIHILAMPKDEMNIRKYNDFKNTILQEEPLLLDDYINSLIKHYKNSEIDHASFLARLLKENNVGNNLEVDEIIKLIKRKTQLSPLEEFEKTLDR